MVKDDIIKGEIVANAQVLFQTYGLKKTTMEDIARSMGKGKSTLYYYYTSKEDIFRDVLQKELREVFSKTETAVAGVSTAEEKLKTFGNTKIAILSQMFNLYRIVHAELTERPLCFGSVFSEYDEKETNLISAILEFGICNKEFKSSLTDYMDILPSTLVSCFRGIERDYFANKLPRLESRIGAISMLLVEGLKK